MTGHETEVKRLTADLTCAWRIIAALLLQAGGSTVVHDATWVSLDRDAILHSEYLGVGVGTRWSVTTPPRRTLLQMLEPEHAVEAHRRQCRCGHSQLDHDPSGPYWGECTSTGCGCEVFSG